MSKWLANGELIVKETITEGVENAAQGLVNIFQGKNFGKGRHPNNVLAINYRMTNSFL